MKCSVCGSNGMEKRTLAEEVKADNLPSTNKGIFECLHCGAVVDSSLKSTMLWTSLEKVKICHSQETCPNFAVECSDCEHKFEINTRDIKITFFKPSGKYYTSEEYEVDSKLQVYEIVKWVKENVKAHKGMYAVITFKDDDSIGFPVMILAEDRQ